MDINNVAHAFNFEGEAISIKAFGSGHINSTYIADFGSKQYVIQKINTSVFKNPDELMDNVFAVTEYLRSEIEKSGGDAERETLNFVKTKDSKKYFKADNGECYRAYVFVKDSVCFDTADSPELFKKSGAAFGRFQRMLGSFPAKTLSETIPHFHDTLYRYENEFKKAIASADKAVLSSCKKETDFVISRKSDTDKITSLISGGEIPLRVTHNDTKLNNVLFDEKTKRALAVIDLDTVMPGSALYDFGDSIRFGASTAAEDESDLSKVSLSLEYFKAYAEGFLSEAGEVLTKTEKENLAFSAKLLTLECGMRFLTDYLNGNTYFKVDYPTHNLVRAKNQFALVSDIESKLEKMNEIIKSL